MLLSMRVRTLMVRSASSRVSNHAATGKRRAGARAKPPSRRSFLPHPEQLAQKVAHRLARFLGRPWIAADMRIELDAGILVGERRVGIGVHKNAAFALANVALPRGLRVRRYRHM